MKESYPYIIMPQKVEKIRSEGIPLPALPQLLPLPEKVQRKYLGTIVFLVSLTVFIVLNLISKRTYIFYMFISLIIALISLVATIFEFVQYEKLKKQYLLDLKLYNENKEAFKKMKASQEKVDQNNKDDKLVKKYQLEKIIDFFSKSYDNVNAIHNEYSLAKKRFKLFLEEYFPDEVMDNVRIIHGAKNLEYIPDFIIKFSKPKLNLAIEVEEPYSLSNVPENIQKDYDAKDRIRQRFANELGWTVIVFSEEQAVKNPTESCKFIEESVEEIFGETKIGAQFAKIPPIIKQKMLTGEERAHMKSTGYREKYLVEAGLMDEPDKLEIKFDSDNNEKEKKAIAEIIQKSTSKDKLTEVDIPEEKNTDKDMNTPEDNKEQIENEQLKLIKKVAQKMKTENGDEPEKVTEQPEPIKFKSDNGADYAEVDENISNDDEEMGKSPEKEKKTEMTKKGEQLRREEDILKDLYKALDKHSRKQQERKEKRLRERLGINPETPDKESLVNKKVETSKENVPEDAEKEKQSEVIVENETTVEKEKTILSEEKMHIEEKESVTLLSDDSSKLLEETIGKTESIEIEELNTVEEKLNEKEKTKEFVEDEKKVEKAIIEETKPVEIKLEDKNIVEEFEVVEQATNEEKPKNEDMLSEDAIKNQKIIEDYREKIEGAVFDKAWDELIELCNSALQEVPFWDWAYYRRSTAWGNKKEFEKVVEDCTRAVGYNPTLADAYYNRGTARFFLAKYRESAEDYQKSIDLNYVKRADAYFNRGLCFQKLDYHKKAYLEFMKAMEMGSHKAEEVLKNQYE